MHKNNIFKNKRPDFRELAKEFPEFAMYVQEGANEKPYVNFKDPASLRALSQVLLKKFFNINIEIPLDRLIPTIPLRLNYIHFIEDLLGDKKKDVYGIDIGCGASCVYGLLGYKMNDWKFIATEIDDESFQYAIKNVADNMAQVDIEVVKCDQDMKLLSPALSRVEDRTFDFVMCNPPFFGELDQITKDRTGHRPPPFSVSTASENESFTEGGEVQFVTNMITESETCRDRVRWYTTMLGKKSSLQQLRKLLQEKEIHFTTSCFHQGRTTRWGLAWTFTEEICRIAQPKERKPLYLELNDDFLEKNDVFHVDEYTTEALWEIIKIVQEDCEELEIQIEEEPTLTALANKDAFEFTAFAAKDTWTGLRKRKRQEKHKQLIEMQKKQQEEQGKSKEKEKKTEEEGKPKGGSVQKDGKDAEPLTLQQQQLLEEFIAKYSSNSYFDGTKEFSLVDTSKDGKKESSKISKEELQELAKISSKEKSYSSKTSKEEKMEVSNNNSKVEKIDLKRPLESENGQEESSKKAKLGESVIPEPMDLSFTFSCTVAFEKQFSELENSDKKIISILCLEGNRDSFHHMFTYFQNKYECKAGIPMEKKGRKSRKQKKREKVAKLSEDKASGEEPNSQGEEMTT